MRFVREEPGRDESKAPAVDFCLAHRCAEHAQLPPMDASADDQSECGVCIGHKFVAAYADAFEADMLKKIYWPMVQSARDRLNLLARGAGDAFEEECRGHVTAYNKPPAA